jgi:ribosomal protein S18 acetylase RimI-like enzyme
LGFEQVGIRRGYYQATVGREDAAVLRRILQDKK